MKSVSRKNALIVWAITVVLSVLTLVFVFPDSPVTPSWKRVDLNDLQFAMPVAFFAIALLAGIFGRYILSIAFSVGNFLGLIMGNTLGVWQNKQAYEAYMQGTGESVPYMANHMVVWINTVGFVVVLSLAITMVTYFRKKKNNRVS